MLAVPANLVRQHRLAAAGAVNKAWQVQCLVRPPCPRPLFRMLASWISHWLHTPSYVTKPKHKLDFLTFTGLQVNQIPIFSAFVLGQQLREGY
jgi:hypothetical protein